MSMTRKQSGSALQTCIMVVGMHRSGTSALARCFNLLGAQVAVNLVPVEAANETGHWEPARLVELHDEMLLAVGSRWADWRSLDLGGLSGEALAELERDIKQRLVEEYGSAPLFVLKDPRASRFAALYEGLFKELGIDLRYAVAYRNPIEVAQSLLARDGIPPAVSYLVWLRHQLDAELASRNVPRAIVSYEALVANPIEELSKIARELEVEWPENLSNVGQTVTEYLSVKYRHHHSDAVSLANNESIPVWVRDTFLCLERLRLNRNDQGAMDELDRVRSAFDAVAAVFGDAYIEAAEAAETKQHSRALAAKLEKIAYEAQSAADLEEVVNKFTVELEEARATLSACVTKFDADLAAYTQSTSWRVTKPLRHARGLVATVAKRLS